jgi:hypothetical protein
MEKLENQIINKMEHQLFICFSFDSKQELLRINFQARIDLLSRKIISHLEKSTKQDLLLAYQLNLHFLNECTKQGRTENSVELQVRLGLNMGIKKLDLMFLH